MSSSVVHPFCRSVKMSIDHTFPRKPFARTTLGNVGSLLFIQLFIPHALNKRLFSVVSNYCRDEMLSPNFHSLMDLKKDSQKYTFSSYHPEY